MKIESASFHFVSNVLLQSAIARSILDAFRLAGNPFRSFVPVFWQLPHKVYKILYFFACLRPIIPNQMQNGHPSPTTKITTNFLYKSSKISENKKIMNKTAYPNTLCMNLGLDTIVCKIFLDIVYSGR